MHDLDDRIWRIDRAAPQVVRATRTPEPFVALAEVVGPLRSDPAFDEVVREHRPRVFEGFHIGAVLVRTLSGKIQLTRHERVDRVYRVFDDEAEALAFLIDALDGV